MTRNLVRAAAGAASLLLAACGATESGTITLSLEQTDCQVETANVKQWLGTTLGAQTIEVTVSGPGMTEAKVSGAVGAGSLDLPEIPEGQDREVIVRAKNSASVVVAAGRSAPIDVKADQDQSVNVPMVGLNRLHPPQSVASGECSAQQGIRAGHAAAAFSDGRALLVGGFLYDSDAKRIEYLDTAELYDPATGEFRPVPSLPPICGASGDESCERAFGAAVVQPLASKGGERFLVIGGEYRDQNGVVRARGEALSFDPAKEEWSSIPLKTARRHHTANLLPNGSNFDVYIVGGFGEPTPGSDAVPVVDQVEVIKSTGETTTIRAPVPRAMHAAVVRNGELLIAGGVDAAYGLPTSVLALSANAASAPPLSVQGGGPIALSQGVVGPSLVLFGKNLVVIGGITPDSPVTNVHDVLRSIPINAGPTGDRDTPGEVIALESASSNAPSFPLEVDRAFACIAPIDANRVFVAGGTTEGGGVVTSNSSAEVLVWVDESQCVPTECTVTSQCHSSECSIDGKCVKRCTSSDECGTKGACEKGVCLSDLKNPDHRCTSHTTCFAGSECIEKGHPERSYVGGSNPAGSKLGHARAWGACTRLSADQILITGGVSDRDRKSLGDAEIYEISHAGR